MSFLFAWHHLLNIYYINVEWIIVKTILSAYVLIFNEKKRRPWIWKKEQGVIYEKIWREQRENDVIIISKEKTFLKLFIPVNEQNSVKGQCAIRLPLWPKGKKQTSGDSTLRHRGKVDSSNCPTRQGSGPRQTLSISSLLIPWAEWYALLRMCTQWTIY